MQIGQVLLVTESMHQAIAQFGDMVESKIGYSIGK